MLLHSLSFFFITVFCYCGIELALSHGQVSPYQALLIGSRLTRRISS